MNIPVQDAEYPTPDQIRDTMLSSVRYTYLRIGIDRNVLPGSDDYKRLDVVAQRIGIAISNGQLQAADANPLTAQGDSLTRLAAVFGVFPRPAAGAAGFVTISFSGSAVTIPTGFQATSPDGHKYVAQFNTYVTGATVPVQAVSAGASTNQLASTILTWDSAAIGALANTATVTSAGLTGGVNADGQETLRQRLLLRLAAAAVGGNWSSIVEWGEASTASVEHCYCYPAAQGPASYRVAVTALGGNRTLPAAIVALVAAYINARMPSQNRLTCTTVTPQAVDVSLKMRLPLPQSAGGAGGGWRDASPWPQEDCKVTAYSAPTATVNSTATPSVGNSIGIWDSGYVDPITGLVLGLMREYTVLTVGGSTGAWTFTVQGGFSSLTSSTPLGCYVSAGAVSMVQYARAFTDGVASLGPGELTALPELLPRALRQPTTDMSAPSDLTSRLLDSVQAGYAEVIDVQWGVKYLSGTTSPLTSPSVPASAASPPNVLTLHSLAIRME